jgi:hypothetical protein
VRFSGWIERIAGTSQKSFGFMPIYGQWYATVKYNENRYFLPIIRDERVVRGEGVVNRLGEY